jgi:CheY-like chemotaxis protein
MSLSNFFNNENIDSSPALLYLKYLNAKTSSLFIYENFEKYTCIEHINLNNTNSTFPTIEFYEDEIIIRNEYKFFNCDFDFTNILIIPCKMYNYNIGLICVTNFTKKELNFEDDELISYYKILENFLCKHKLKLLLEKNNFSNEMFIANMSHEIRTPLNGIIGYTQLLNKTSLNSIQQNYINSMNKCSIQLLSIINDIIDFSKLASGNMSINEECFELNEIIKTVESVIGNRIEEKKQNIKYTIDENIPSYIYSDKQKIIQIIINLVSNASKFSDNNTIIKINFESIDINMIKVSIIDKGIGISEDDISKIFNSFIQIKNSVIKTPSGSGLGLAISKKLVELLHGTLNVTSKLHTGSTFYFTFKYQLCNNIEIKLDKSLELLKDKYILVVDDNIDNRILISDLLFEWKMNPIVCASAVEALKMIMNNRYSFSLGLIDICMPQTDGIQLAQQIKEEIPDLPLIALSSSDSFINSYDFEKKLDKPINKIKLYDTIYYILKKNNRPTSYIGNINEQQNIKCKYDKNIKILIAEDIEFNQIILTDMLKLIGFNNIDIVEDGIKTINYIDESIKNNNLYTILLLDIKMPNMNGYEVINILKEKYKYMCKDIPEIVVVTASVLDSEKIKCKSLGIKYFINKPIQLLDLKEVIIDILKKK